MENDGCGVSLWAANARGELAVKAEALLTGESRPQRRQCGDTVLAGSHNVSDRVCLRITGLGEDTRHAQIVGLMNNAALDKPRMAQLADRLAKPFLWGVMLAALAAFAYGATQGMAHAVMAAASVLIVTCPCALSLATPSALIAATGRLAKEGVLVRKVQVLDALAHIDTVVFDKTGTLTTGLTELERLWSVAHPQGWSASSTPAQAVHPATLDVVAWVGAAAAASAHPVSRALSAFAQAQISASHQADARAAVTQVREVPGLGLVAQLERQGQRHVLCVGSLAHVQSGQPLATLPDAAKAATVHVTLDGQWAMSLAFGEQLRPDAVQALQHLREMGLGLRLLSGDRPEQVERMARALGLSPEHAMGHCTPADKLHQIQALQARGHRLLMVGDGFNDMPVLAGAEVSMAFAQAVALAQAHADVVTLGEQLMAVPRLIALSRQTLGVIRGSLVWAVAYNLVSIPLAVLGGLPPALAGLGMAASSLWVVIRALPLNKAPTPHVFVQDR